MRKIILIFIFFPVLLFAQQPIYDDLEVYGTTTMKKHAEAEDSLTTPVAIIDTVKFSDGSKLYSADGIDLLQPIDSLSFSGLVPVDAGTNYTIYADTLTKRLVYHDDGGLRYFDAQDDVPFVNTTGTTILPQMGLSSAGIDFSKGRGIPSVNIVNCINKELAYAFTGVASDTVAIGEIGQLLIRNFQFINTSSFEVGEEIWIGCDSMYTNQRPLSPYYSLFVGVVAVKGVSGVINVAAQPFVGSDTDVNLEGAINGIKTKNINIYSYVNNDTLWVEYNNSEDTTQDIPVMYSNDRYNLNSTSGEGRYGRARINLEWGSNDTVPLKEYVYLSFTSGEPELAVSTVGYPDDNPQVTSYGVFTQTKHESYGFGYIRRVNDGIDGSNGRGLIKRIMDWIRDQGSLIKTGVESSVTIVSSAGIDTLKLSTTSGTGRQFNIQSIQSLDSDTIHWWFSPNGGDSIVTHLSAINIAYDGSSLRSNNSYYRINWFLAMNSGGEQYIAAIASNGKYSSSSDAVNNVGNLAVTTPPDWCSDVVVRVGSGAFSYITPGGGTIANLLGSGNYNDERNFPFGYGGVGGISGGSGSYPVADNSFSLSNSADPTKLGTFDLSTVPTGTEISVQWPSADGQMVTKTDTSNLLLTHYAGDTLQENIDEKLNTSDTAAMLNAYIQGTLSPSTVDYLMYSDNSRAYSSSGAYFAGLNLWLSGYLYNTSTSGFNLKPGAATSTIPTLVPNRSSQNTGIGGLVTTISLISNSDEKLRVAPTGLTLYDDMDFGSNSLTLNGSSITDWPSGGGGVDLSWATPQSILTASATGDSIDDSNLIIYDYPITNGAQITSNDDDSIGFISLEKTQTSVGHTVSGSNRSLMNFNKKKSYWLSNGTNYSIEADLDSNIFSIYSSYSKSPVSYYDTIFKLQRKLGELTALINSDVHITGNSTVDGSLKGVTNTESFATTKTIDFTNQRDVEYTVTGNTTITIDSVPKAFNPKLALINDVIGGHTTNILGATKWSSTNNIDTSANAINLLEFEEINGKVYYFVTTHNPSTVSMSIITSSISEQISTTPGDSVTIFWGDGDSDTYSGTDITISHTYSSSDTFNMVISAIEYLTKINFNDNNSYDFDVSELTTSSIVYLRVEGSNTISGSLSGLTNLTYLEITGSNTVSGSLSGLTSLTYLRATGSNTISGSLSGLTSLTTLVITGSNTVSGDMSVLTSLTYLIITGSNTVSGDISGYTSVTFFRIEGSNTVSDYTTTTFDSGIIRFVVDGFNTLSTSEVDQILIDLEASATWSSGEIITITGNSQSRSSASDAAVTSLTGQGVTVTTN